MGGVTYTGTGESVRKLTSVEQKANLTSVIFKVFARGRTSNLDGGKGGRLELTFGPFASVGLFTLPISHSGARGRIKPENKTEVALSVEKERKPLIPPPPHFAINLAGKRAAADAQTADDVICNHGPLVSVENCCRTQHVAVRPPPSSPLRRGINSGGIRR